MNASPYGDYSQMQMKMEPTGRNSTRTSITSDKYKTE